MRLGLFGGTFDPPHVGHLIAASDAFEALALDRLVFVPNCTQPLKAEAPKAPATDRLEMVRRLCHGDTRFSVDSIEIDRGGLSYTVDTLREYRGQYPDAALFLLLGEDAAATLPSWREPATIRELAEVVVLTRGPVGSETPTDPRRVSGRRIDVSSTEIRDRVRANRSLAGFTMAEVQEYIAVHGLYRT